MWRKLPCSLVFLNMWIYWDKWSWAAHSRVQLNLSSHASLWLVGTSVMSAAQTDVLLLRPQFSTHRRSWVRHLGCEFFVPINISQVSYLESGFTGQECANKLEIWLSLMVCRWRRQMFTYFKISFAHQCANRMLQTWARSRLSMEYRHHLHWSEVLTSLCRAGRRRAGGATDGGGVGRRPKGRWAYSVRCLSME